MPPGETSPYSALSAMAIDPQFITIEPLEDFAAIGGEAALEPALRARLDAVRVGAANRLRDGPRPEADRAAAARSRASATPSGAAARAAPRRSART